MGWRWYCMRCSTDGKPVVTSGDDKQQQQRQARLNVCQANVKFSSLSGGWRQECVLCETAASWAARAGSDLFY